MKLAVGPKMEMGNIFHRLAWRSEELGSSDIEWGSMLELGELPRE